MILPAEIQQKANEAGVRDTQMEKDLLLSEFSAKCSHKELNSSNFPVVLERRLPQYEARWTGSISDQIKELPEYEQVEREVQRHFRKYF